MVAAKKLVQSAQDISACATQIHDHLHKRYGASAYTSWFSKCHFAQGSATEIIYYVPTRFVKEWIHSNYGDVIYGLWQKSFPTMQHIHFMVNPDHFASTAVAGNTNTMATPASPTSPALQSPPEQLSLTLQHHLDARFTLDQFVVAESNKLAFGIAKAVANNEAIHCNPLFLYGAVGVGKTHLMHGIAWELARGTPSLKIAYMSAEQFMYHFIRALKHHDIMTFKEQLRAVDLLLIDDVQFICGKENTQQEFMQTFNALTDSQKKVIITCDRAPSELSSMGERDRSRLGGGLVIDIMPSDKALRGRIVRSKIAALGEELPEAVVDYLAQHIASNIRELEGALMKLIAFRKFTGVALTLESVEPMVKDMVRTHTAVVSIEMVQKITAQFFSMAPNELLAISRKKPIVEARQLAMYVAKQMTSCSLVEISRKFGKKDHTTVLHAVQKVQQALEQGDQSMHEAVNHIQKQLRG